MNLEMRYQDEYECKYDNGDEYADEDEEHEHAYEY